MPSLALENYGTVYPLCECERSYGLKAFAVELCTQTTLIAVNLENVSEDVDNTPKAASRPRSCERQMYLFVSKGDSALRSKTVCALNKMLSFD